MTAVRSAPNALRGAAFLLLVAFAVLAPPMLARDADAAGLPYQAYGSGLRAGATVEAFKGTTSAGRATVDVLGNWVLIISSDVAVQGDTVTFKVDGAAAAQTVTFVNGGYSPLPGLALTVAAPVAVPTAVTPPALAVGIFVSPPAFSANGLGAVVFTRGSTDQLLAATIAANATGAWVQDPTGRFQLLIPGAPPFILDAFKAAFPSGFTVATNITLTK